MLVKGIFFICIQAILYEAVFSQCIGPSIYPGEAVYPTNFPIFEGYNTASVAPLAPIYGRVVGGNLIVDTSAPYAATGPAGVSVFSDNLLIEGAVLVNGNLPFTGTVALEGIVPAAGTGAVSYECSSGNVAIVSEGISALNAGPVLPVNGLPYNTVTSAISIEDTLLHHSTNTTYFTASTMLNDIALPSIF